jgi:glycosyltransferase involved in cell wall biosynthesis
MRILMLTQFYPPFIGGEERAVWNLSGELAARGHEVAVATLGGEGLPELDYERGVRIYRMRSTVERLSWLYRDPARRHAPPIPDPGLVRSLRAIVRRERPDIVHAHNWLVHSFLPLKPWSGAKLVLSLHDYSYTCATKKLLYRDALCSGPGLRKCLECAAQHYGPLKGAVTASANWEMGVLERRLVDMFLPVSETTAEANGIRSAGLPYQIIPNFLPSIPASTGDIGGAVEQLPPDGFLLFVGAFGAYKGVDVLLEAYAQMDSAPPLVLIGYETAESPVQTSRLPRGVIRLTDVPHSVVMEAWRRCSIGLVPSIVAETFGLVALEAMSVGRPVIASRIGGLGEVVRDGETGLLVSPGDTDALRHAMERLIADEKLRDRLGRAAAVRAREFSAEAVVPRLEEVYSAVIDPERSRTVTRNVPEHARMEGTPG